MKPVRIIPRLDVKGANLVKGVHLEGLRVIGRPERFAGSYYQDGADELLYIDVVASLYGRNNLEEIVKRTAEDVFIPITVGGGIRSIDDIRRLLNAGADKVAINTAAIRNPNLITEGARVFGSQCIVVSIQAMKVGRRKYEPYTDNGREPTGMGVVEWVRQAVDLGAGEILITSIDQEGTGNGFDLELFSEAVASVPVPVIACGGAGKAEHFEEIIKDCNVDAVSASSIFHYNTLFHTGVEKQNEGNTEYIRKFLETNGSILRSFNPVSISHVKSHLKKSNSCLINSRLCDDKEVFSKKLQMNVATGESKSISPYVVVIDYGRSNLFSIEFSLKAMNAKVEITNDPIKISKADKLIIAGVGAFGDSMKRLRSRDIVPVICENASKGKPILGICLGMQLFVSESEEFGLHEGLDLIKGRVVKLKEFDEDKEKTKIPHIGWNQLVSCQDNLSSNEYVWEKDPFMENILPGDSVYFAHSYVVVPEDRGLIVGETQYGSNRFCSIIRKDNLIGCQFHPEKSGKVGFDLLKNFVFNL